VVRLLLRCSRCKPNVRNRYGQAAIHFAAMNKRVSVIEALLDAAGGAAAGAAGAEVAPTVDIELVAAGATAAEVARRAGHEELADLIAARATETQVGRILRAITEGETATTATVHDSLRGRLTALCAELGHEPRAAEEDDDDDAPGLELPDGLPRCSICLEHAVEMALKPCFHSAFCSACAGDIAMRGMPCPICRSRVTGSQRIFL
jgi:hypothetical protein